jgi:prepilin-type N-terminal cleavage/methylation domain-containing protein
VIQTEFTEFAEQRYKFLMNLFRPFCSFCRRKCSRYSLACHAVALWRRRVVKSLQRLNAFTLAIYSARVAPRIVSGQRSAVSSQPRLRRGIFSRFTNLECRSSHVNARSPLTSDVRHPRLAVAVRRRLTSEKRRRFSAFTLPKLRERVRAFTLLEMLVVMGVIAILLVLVAPAFTNLKSASDVSSAANTIKGLLDQARTYAMANNTYTWVGFYEEDVSTPSTNPPTAGTGRIVMSIVASKDGTMIYTAPLTTVVTLAPANLIQVGKLTKIDNLHLQTFPDATATPPPDTFDTRPLVGSSPRPDLTARIGDSTPSSPSLRFQYPVGGTAQYTFAKIVQFNPRGEPVIDNSNYTFTPVSEIGLEPTHGNVTPNPTPANLVAVQFTGMGGDVKIYRR